MKKLNPKTLEIGAVILGILISFAWNCYATSYTFNTTDGNWETNARWIPATGHPIAGDTANMTSTSGNITLGTDAACAVFNGTGAVKKLNIGAFNLTVTGNLDLPSGVGGSTAGTGILKSTSNGNWWAHGCPWNGSVMANVGSGTMNFNDTWQINSSLIINQSEYINGSTIHCNGLTMNAAMLGGTALVDLQNGSWSSAANAYIFTNLTINGTSTISGAVYSKSPVINWTSGQPTVTGSTLHLGVTGMSLNTSGMNWGNIQSDGAYTSILLSDLHAVDLVYLGYFQVFFNGPYNVTFTGNLTGGGGGALAGNASYIYTGTGGVGSATWADNSNGYVNANLTINGSGNLTLGAFANLVGAGHTLKYINGNVNATANNNIFLTYGATINASGMVFNNVSWTTGGTTTLQSDFNAGDTINQTAISEVISGAYNISCANYTLGSGGTLTMPQNQYFNMTNAVVISGGYYTTTLIKSGTVGTPFNFNYGGSIANEQIAWATFNDTTASNMPIFNMFGKTSTNTTNIYNENMSMITSVFG